MTAYDIDAMLAAADLSDRDDRMELADALEDAGRTTEASDMRSGLAWVRMVYKEASGSWTGLDWTATHGVYEIDIDGLDADELREAAEAADSQEDHDCSYCDRYWSRHAVRADGPASGQEAWENLAEELRSAADYIDAVTSSAEEAEQLAEEAVEAFERGDLVAAYQAAKAAVSCESEYGDSPTWRVLRDSIWSLMN